MEDCSSLAAESETTRFTNDSNVIASKSHSLTLSESDICELGLGNLVQQTWILKLHWAAPVTILSWSVQGYGFQKKNLIFFHVIMYNVSRPICNNLDI